MLSVIRNVSPIVNTPRIAFADTWCLMTTEQAERLKAAREKAGYKTAGAAAEQFGWTASAYRHHENGTRGFGLDVAKKYGRAFRVKPGWLLAMEGVNAEAPTDFLASSDLIVEGAVAAGVWREPTDSSSVRMRIDTPPPVQNVKRFGLVVEGHSMDLHYEPGTVLDCISIFTNGVEPATGDHVIVERTKPDGLRELTVKEFVERDGLFYLIPKSTRPDFKEMQIGRPDCDVIDGDEVKVIGFVVSSIPPRALGLLKRMGKVKATDGP